MNKKFIDSPGIYFKNKNILLRVDFNVPIKDNIIQDDKRIVSTYPTINYLIKKKINNLIIISHLGRPNGTINKKLSLKIVYDYLQKYYSDKDIFFTNLENYKNIINSTNNSIILLENIRFYPEEERKSTSDNIVLFENKIKDLADIYVNDAFGTSHRNHCSIIAKGYNLKLGGFLINKELKEINRITTNPKRPFVCILGGAKVSDKIKLIYNLLDKIDDLIIGGGMAFTFLKVMFNMPIGKSLFDKEGCNEIQKIIDKAEKNNVKIHLPLDFIGSEEFNNTDSKYFNRNTGISKNYMGLDIGNKSIKYFNKIIDKSETILWNGPMGVFEFSNFCNGSKSVVTKIEQISHSKNIVIGGGDTASCYLNFSSNTDYVHVSTGGGATLKLLEGKSLYGIESLSN